MKVPMKTLMMAAVILSSVHAFASPAELFLGTWEGKGATLNDESCSVQMVISAGTGESELQMSHSIRCQEPATGERGQNWVLNLRADGVIGPDGINGEHLPPATWTRSEIRFADPLTGESLVIKRSSPVLDVVPYLQYQYTDRLGGDVLQLTGVLTKTK